MAALTIGENDGIVTHSVSGASTGPFAFDFAYFLASEISVVKTTSAGVVSTLVQGTDYTLTGVAADDGYSSGSITLAVAVSSCTLAIVRTLSLAKSSNLAVTGKFPVTALNTLLSRLFSAAQDYRRKSDLAVSFPDTEIGVDSDLPAATLRASKYFGFDSLGNISMLTSPASTTAVSGAMGPVIIAATLAAARTAMGVPGLADINAFSAANSFSAAVTFTGATVVPAPTAATHAVRKSYADQGDRQRIWGLTYANNAGDATNDIDIAAGGCMDATGAYWISLSALTKQSDAAWAVGTAAGGLDTGAVGNSDYFIWAIARSDTGVTDILFSLSATAPTMPTSYDYKRLIGWFRRSGGTIVGFKTMELSGGGLRMRWKTPVADASNVSLTTTYATVVLSVPLGLAVKAFGNVACNAGGNGLNIREPGTTDGTPAVSTTPGFAIGATGSSTNIGGFFQEVTNTSGQVEWAGNAAIGGNYIFTKGFEWSRR